MRVLIFDTETTGLPKSRSINPDSLHLWPHIVQFSYIIYDVTDNDICVIEDNIIRVADDVEISQESAAIHGITNEISKSGGVDLNQVLSGFFGALKNVDMLVGHNISFDINVVVVELLRIIYNQSNTVPVDELLSYKTYLHMLNNYQNIHCTMQNSIDMCAIKVMGKNGREYNKFPKLSELHQKLFDSVPNNLHNSLNDILITLRCYIMITLKMDVLETCDKFKTMSRVRRLLS
jgi:DNA polymerase III epsilon subunit-like protein